MEPGPKMGAILEVLLAEVLEDPALNKKDLLLKRAKDLERLDLKEIREKAQEVIEEKREAEDEGIKKKFKV